MKVICLIPARLGSTRFHGKLLQKLGNKTVIEQTYIAAKNLAIFEEIWVATDSELIGNTIKNSGGNVFYSKKEHPSGSDRIAEAAEEIEADIIVNVQGDTPLLERKSILELIEVFKKDVDTQIDLASLMTDVKENDGILSPNVVKVVVDKQNFALYFSRSAIPFVRNMTEKPSFFQHIGVYAFRKKALLEFYHAEQTPLEKAELVECLRYLEMGKKIKMIYTDEETIEIDTPEDWENAKKWFI